MLGYVRRHTRRSIMFGVLAILVSGAVAFGFSEPASAGIGCTKPGATKYVGKIGGKPAYRQVSYCYNEANVTVYRSPWVSSGSIGTLTTSHSWFVCYKPSLYSYPANHNRPITYQWAWTVADTGTHGMGWVPVNKLLLTAWEYGMYPRNLRTCG